MDWSFLRATLAMMGFRPSFISWVNLFYASPQSAVKFNGHMTTFFDLSRGVRQGVLLSPPLYVLYAEVLACAIHANPPISALTLPGCSTPLPVISQYADDTSLVVTSDQSLIEVFRSYAVFERGSGSKLNLGKSKGLWLGSWNGRTDAPVNLSWTSDKLKVLGGVIGLVLGMWRRTIGVPELLLWRMFFNLGKRRPFLTRAGPLLSTHWPSLVFGTWLLFLVCPPGWFGN